MSDVPKRFSTDNSSISVAKKRRKINQDSSLGESNCSSEEAAYSQCNDEDQSDTSEGSGTSIFDILTQSKRRARNEERAQCGAAGTKRRGFDLPRVNMTCASPAAASPAPPAARPRVLLMSALNEQSARGSRLGGRGAHKPGATPSNLSELSRVFISSSVRRSDVISYHSITGMGVPAAGAVATARPRRRRPPTLPR
ncbi:hypothetical protein EVAR_22066_1 [Eumeta japonica]|uniref:Uncharacterized protein n=1 Tax=Eumeta variegata TaxID=151549 RepID=A0A4C1UUG6_EUMVA|nr:hypothetical protein EVAR_22066_1 [Eumeta japonica]